MDRFNSLFVFLLLSFFAVSVSAIVSSDHVVVSTSSTHRNSTTSSSEEEDFDLLKKAEHHFTNFVKKYGKTYADEEEHAYRLSVFKSNLRRAKRHQKLDPTAVHGITQYSDLTLMEFKRKFLGGSGGGGFGVKRVKLLENNVGGKATILPTNDLPADFDWRDRGVVTPVKDQGACASSYAFSALGAIEGAHILATGKIYDLSEQEIIDCSLNKYSDELNFGCKGGAIFQVLEHVRNKGFISEQQYPYFSGQTRTPGPCKIPAVRSITSRVANFSAVNSVNEDQIAANLVKNGPLAVTMKTNALFLSTYVGGVSCPLICPMFRDHAVVLVGYGAGAYSPTRLKKEPYWILKNSWGKTFGENGYFRTCKGNDGANCGGMDIVYTVSTTRS